jgi:hypothetical protein
MDAPFGLLDQMGSILFVFIAEHFENVLVGQKRVRDIDSERPGVDLGIVKGHFYVQVTEVAAVEALSHMENFAVKVAH